jgi:hypothetical protein
MYAGSPRAESVPDQLEESPYLGVAVETIFSAAQGSSAVSGTVQIAVLHGVGRLLTYCKLVHSVIWGGLELRQYPAVMPFSGSLGGPG